MIYNFHEWVNVKHTTANIWPPAIYFTIRENQTYMLTMEENERLTTFHWHKMDGNVLGVIEYCKTWNNTFIEVKNMSHGFECEKCELRI